MNFLLLDVFLSAFFIFVRLWAVCAFLCAWSFWIKTSKIVLITSFTLLLLLWETLIDKFTWPLDFVVLQNHVKSLNHFISGSVVTMANKLGRMVIYFESLLSIKSHDPLLKWSGEIAWQTKNMIFLPLQCNVVIYQ